MTYDNGNGPVDFDLPNRLAAIKPSRTTTRCMTWFGLVMSWLVIFNAGRLIGIGFPDGVYADVIVPALTYNWFVLGHYIYGGNKDLQTLTDKFGGHLTGGYGEEERPYQAPEYRPTYAQPATPNPASPYAATPNPAAPYAATPPGYAAPNPANMTPPTP